LLLSFADDREREKTFRKDIDCVFQRVGMLLEMIRCVYLDGICGVRIKSNSSNSESCCSKDNYVAMGQTEGLIYAYLFSRCV
jgi:hypothetical protein